jgi:hypothetical protein
MHNIAPSNGPRHPRYIRARTIQSKKGTDASADPI